MKNLVIFVFLFLEVENYSIVCEDKEIENKTNQIIIKDLNNNLIKILNKNSYIFNFSKSFKYTCIYSYLNKSEIKYGN